MANNIDRCFQLENNVHRRILGFLNAARRPEDLMVPPPNEVVLIDQRVMHGNEEAIHADEHRKEAPKAPPLLERELAKRVLQVRDDISPLYGFQHIRQLETIPGFNRGIFDRIFEIFSARSRGKWELLYDAD